MDYKLLLILALIYFVNSQQQGIESLDDDFDIPQYAKDRYLACSKIVAIKLKKDEKIIDELFKEKNKVVRLGLYRTMQLDMAKMCADNMDDELLSLLYHNYEPLGDPNRLQLSLVNNLIPVNYEEYAKKNEFIYSKENIQVMNLLKLVFKEERQYKKDLEKFGKKKNSTETENKDKKQEKNETKVNEKKETKKTEDL